MLEGRLSIKNNRIPLIEPVSKETVPQRGRFSDFSGRESQHSPVAEMPSEPLLGAKRSQKCAGRRMAFVCQTEEGGGEPRGKPL